ncbi:MAG: hypothetical protein IBJ10_04185 [Phycisphaerales bacterium]|nr:hypothetical protein [Phycisphaerales bacterium]
MSRAACFLGADLSVIRLFAPSGDQVWRRPEPAPDEAEDALWWRRQAGAGAQWVQEHLGGATLDAVCLDVAGASCVWMSAPSADPAVIAAAMRQPDSSWDELGVVGTVQPLTEPAAPAATASIPFLSRKVEDLTPARLAVVATPDGMARLWFDALARRGVEAGPACTLWPAIQRAWGGADPTPDELPAVVVHDGARLVWTFGRGPNLVAAGSAGLLRKHAPRPEGDGPAPAPSPPPEPWDFASACGRLTLDWLTWVAQIGAPPRTVLAVGPENERLAQALQRAWPDAQTRAIHEADPVAGATGALIAERPGASSSSDSDPRRTLVALSRRRGRSHRWLYTWLGATMALLAVAIGAYALRQRDLAADFRAERANLTLETKKAVREVAPDLAERPDRVMALRAELVRIRQGRPEFAEPVPAKPILEEFIRLAGVIAEMGAVGVQPEEFVLFERMPSARVRVPDYATGDDLRARLNAAPGAIRWKVDLVGPLGAEGFRYQLQGEWTEAPR